MVWRPVRERTPAVLEQMAEAMLRTTGHDELSLLSLSSGDYSRIEPLLTTLMDRYYSRRVALALPSLRAETLTPRLIEGIRRVRKTSFTLAPEAGTQRLRDVINKGNTEEELLATTERVFAAGWKAVKLYFMLGLPGEREEDLEGIAELAHRVLRTAKNRGQVTVSLSTFVPKPHTPFQWQRQIGIGEIVARQEFFKRRLKNRNISVKWHDARMSLLEGIFSRGGEETGDLIETAFRLGCRFDGWSDHFRFDLWEEALRRTGIDAEACLRERPRAEIFPWERIDCGVRRDFLLAEAEKAEQGEATPDCRTGSCGDCGVCGDRTGTRCGIVSPVIAPADAPIGTIVSAFAGRGGAGGTERAFRLRFTKLGPARFLSHMELSSALSRAMILGGIFFVYSQGFHPHPRISFAGATAVGMESRGEFADIRIQDPQVELKTLVARINAGLPSGVAVTAMRELPPHDFSLAELVKGFVYDIMLPRGNRRGGSGPVRSRYSPVSRPGELPCPPGGEREDDHQGDPPPRCGPRPGPAFPPDHPFSALRSGGDGPPHRASDRSLRAFPRGDPRGPHCQDGHPSGRFRRTGRPGNLRGDMMLHRVPASYKFWSFLSFRFSSPRRRS